MKTRAASQNVGRFLCTIILLNSLKARTFVSVSQYNCIVASLTFTSPIDQRSIRLTKNIIFIFKISVITYLGVTKRVDPPHSSSGCCKPD